MAAAQALGSSPGAKLVAGSTGEGCRASAAAGAGARAARPSCHSHATLVRLYLCMSMHDRQQLRF